MFAKYITDLANELIDADKATEIDALESKRLPISVLFTGATTKYNYGSLTDKPVMIFTGRRRDGRVAAVAVETKELPGCYVKVPSYLPEYDTIDTIEHYINILDDIISNDPVVSSTLPNTRTSYSKPTIDPDNRIKYMSYPTMEYDGNKMNFYRKEKFIRIEFDRATSKITTFLDQMINMWEFFTYTELAHSLRQEGYIIDDRIVRNADFLKFFEYYKRAQVDHGESVMAACEISDYAVVAPSTIGMPDTIVCYRLPSMDNIKQLVNGDDREGELINAQVTMSYDIEVLSTFKQRADGSFPSAWLLPNYIMLISCAVGRLGDSAPIARFTLSLKTPTEEEVERLFPEIVFGYDFVDPIEFKDPDVDQTPVDSLYDKSIAGGFHFIRDVVSYEVDDARRQGIASRVLKDLARSYLDITSHFETATRRQFGELVNHIKDQTNLGHRILEAEGRMLDDFMFMLHTIFPTTIIAYNGYGFDNIYLAIRYGWRFLYNVVTEEYGVFSSSEWNKPEFFAIATSRSTIARKIKEEYKPIFDQYLSATPDIFASGFSLMLKEQHDQEGATGKPEAYFSSPFIGNTDPMTFIISRYAKESTSGFKLKNILISFDIKDADGNPVNKDDLDIPQMYDDWASDMLFRPIHYCSKDAAVLFYLEKNRDIIMNQQSMSKISGLRFADVTHSRGGKRNAVTISMYSKHMDVLLYDLRARGQKYDIFRSMTMVGGDTRAGQFGAIIAVSGIDFASMYPSIFEGKGISPNGILPGILFDPIRGEKARSVAGIRLVSEHKIADPFGLRSRFFLEIGDTFAVVEELFATVKPKGGKRGQKLTSDDLYRAICRLQKYLDYDGDRFVSHDPETNNITMKVFVVQHAKTSDTKAIYRHGILSAMLNSMRHLRNATKKQMKGLDKDSPQRVVLDAKQNAIKIDMNSVYGSTGSPVLPHYNLESGAAITHQSRSGIRSLTKIIACEDFVIPTVTSDLFGVTKLAEALNNRTKDWIDPYCTVEEIVIEPGLVPMLSSSTWRIDTDGHLFHDIRPEAKFVPHDDITSHYDENTIIADITIYLTDAWFPPENWDGSVDMLRTGTPYIEYVERRRTELGIFPMGPNKDLSSHDLAYIYDTDQGHRPHVIAYRLKMPAGRMVYQDTDSNYFVSDYILQHIGESYPGHEIMDKMRAANIAHNELVAELARVIFDTDPISVGYEGGKAEMNVAKTKNYFGRNMNLDGTAPKEFSTLSDDTVALLESYNGDRMKFMYKYADIFVKGLAGFKKNVSQLTFMYCAMALSKRFDDPVIWNNLHCKPITKDGAIRRLPTPQDANDEMMKIAVMIMNKFKNDARDRKIPIDLFVRYHSYNRKDHALNKMIDSLDPSTRPSLGKRVPYVVTISPEETINVLKGVVGSASVASRSKFILEGVAMPSLDDIDLVYYGKGLAGALAGMFCVIDGTDGVSGIAKSLENKLRIDLGRGPRSRNLIKNSKSAKQAQHHLARHTQLIGGVQSINSLVDYITNTDLKQFQLIGNPFKDLTLDRSIKPFLRTCDPVQKERCKNVLIAIILATDVLINAIAGIGRDISGVWQSIANMPHQRQSIEGLVDHMIRYLNSKPPTSKIKRSSIRTDKTVRDIMEASRETAQLYINEMSTDFFATFKKVLRTAEASASRATRTFNRQIESLAKSEIEQLVSRNIQERSVNAFEMIMGSSRQQSVRTPEFDTTDLQESIEMCEMYRNTLNVYKIAQGLKRSLDRILA